MAISEQKLRTLRVMQILLEKTDEDHVLSAQKIIELLEKNHGMTADRKSIYSDMELLQEFGFDIVQNKGTNPGYCIASRHLELPELKLLVDAVQSSKFITPKMSKELIDKLKKLTNEENAKQLQRQVYIYNRPKTDNKVILYNVDLVHNAIYQNKQIEFKYLEWTAEGKQKFRYDGRIYKTSPWALTWDDQFYYLIAYDEKHKDIVHYRVDRMIEVSIVEEHRLGADTFNQFDMGSFTKKTFSMFNGEDERVTIQCHNDLIGVVIDRFGKDIGLRKVDEQHVCFSTTVTVSPQFYGWLTGIGPQMQIQNPEWVRKDYMKYLKNLLENYENLGV